MWFLLDGIEFVYTNETVHEDAVEGHVNLVLRLFRPAIVNITVQLITVSTSATGESCTGYYYTTHELWI